MSGVVAPKIVRNCPASWNRMHGDRQVRFCTHCDQKVYNLTEMTEEQVQKLLAEATGRTCVRYYRRADGTIMTSDCGRIERTKIVARTTFVSAFTLLGLAMKFNAASPTEQGDTVTGKLAVHESTEPVADRQGYVTGEMPSLNGSL